MAFPFRHLLYTPALRGNTTKVLVISCSQLQLILLGSFFYWVALHCSNKPLQITPRKSNHTLIFSAGGSFREYLLFSVRSGAPVLSWIALFRDALVSEILERHALPLMGRPSLPSASEGIVARS